MSDTASVRIYKIGDSVDLDVVTTSIVKNKYTPLEFAPDIQKQQEVEVLAFTKPNDSIPDWVRMVNPYLKDHDKFKNFHKYDIIALLRCKSKNERLNTFAFCAGSGYYGIAPYVDHTFGISVLERVFDPRLNKIAAVAEKGIVGDILASRRFYRRDRPVAYEDDFGKYFQGLDIRFQYSQIKQKLPRFADRRKENGPTISVSGSSSVEIRVRMNLFTLVLLVKDLADLIDIVSPPVFNRTLIPLDNKIDGDLVAHLNETSFVNLVNFCIDPKAYPIDFDFCHREFEAFFNSAVCELTAPGLTNTKGNELEPVLVDDVYALNGPLHVPELVRTIERSIEYRKADDILVFLKDQLKRTQVITRNEEGSVTTSGNLKEYLQLEIQRDGVSYFLLDSKWYLLQNEFDYTLTNKYVKRVGCLFKEFNFTPKWNGPDETAYNMLYNNPPTSFCLHPIKVDNVELCDCLVVDSLHKKTFILHVKNGIGATVRDLTSQAYIAARIIEEEAMTQEKSKLKKLYGQAVSAKRIDPKVVSENDFLDWLSTHDREHVLVVHSDDPEEVKKGKFSSRIAKFSLVEFAGIMNVNGWPWSICCV
jgi:hypothetical protein